jgi:hypothetical protein
VLAGRAAGRLREGGGPLGLVELTGWAALQAHLPPAVAAHLRTI